MPVDHTTQRLGRWVAITESGDEVNYTSLSESFHRRDVDS